MRQRLEVSGGRVLQLETSYRSVPSIQCFVNAAFGRAMIADEWTRAGRLRTVVAVQAGGPSQPSVVALAGSETVQPPELWTAEGVG